MRTVKLPRLICRRIGHQWEEVPPKTEQDEPLVRVRCRRCGEEFESLDPYVMRSIMDFVWERLKEK